MSSYGFSYPESVNVSTPSCFSKNLGSSVNFFLYHDLYSSVKNPPTCSITSIDIAPVNILFAIVYINLGSTL